MTDRYITDRYITDRYITDRYMTDRYITDRYITDRYITDRYMTDRYITDRYITDRYMTDRYYMNYYLSGSRRSLVARTMISMLLQDNSSTRTGMIPAAVIRSICCLFNGNPSKIYLQHKHNMSIFCLNLGGGYIWVLILDTRTICTTHHATN